MEKFTKLIAWQKEHQLVIETYKTVSKFPKSEKFVLVPQILRAAISVAANLAEATKRKTYRDQVRFFNIAEASLEEVKYYIILATDLDYLSKENSKELLDLSREVGRLINGLINQNKFSYILNHKP